MPRSRISKPLRGNEKFRRNLFEISLRGMDREFLIQLTNTLYRLTLLFPKKEPLRYKMRELGDCILVKPSEKDLEILDSFFEIAKAQNWVSPSDMLAIQEEYANLRGELKKPSFVKATLGCSPATGEAESKDNPGENPMIEVRPKTLSMQTVSERTERQEKILTFLKENGRAQVWQMKQVFPEVTKRTLRRDFEYMLGEGIIERIGEKNNTFYQASRDERGESNSLRTKIVQS